MLPFPWHWHQAMIGIGRDSQSTSCQSMEDKDVNPLIESTKPFSRILHDSRAKFVKFCNKYRSEIFFGTSILLVSLCLGVILSILFQGGKLVMLWKFLSMILDDGLSQVSGMSAVCVFVRQNVSCFEFKGSINVSCGCHPFPPELAGPVYRNLTRVWAPCRSRAVFTPCHWAGCHTHFLGDSLNQSQARDQDQDQSESSHLETRDKNKSSELMNPAFAWSEVILCKINEWVYCFRSYI